MGLRNAAKCLFDPYTGGPPGKDARRKAENPRCKRQASSAPNVRADCADSCNSDAFPTGFGTRASVPLSAASSPTTASSMPILASEAAQHTTTAHSASSGNPNATPCAVATTNRGMSAGAVMAFWTSWRCVRVGGARRLESECCGARAGPTQR